jgi:lantibiotic modifying enzyme
MAWERTLLEPARHDWPVRVAGPAPGAVERRYLGAWCHGAPGIGLARVARLARREDDGARADLDVALAFAAGAALPEADHLCCGTASRLALLAAAGRALGAERALADGRALARRALARAGGRGGWAVTPGVEPSERSDVGFFRGYPGLAWSLISLTSAGAELPLVASLELPSERRRRLRSPS